MSNLDRPTLALAQEPERDAYVLRLGEIPYLALEVVAALRGHARVALFARPPRRFRADDVDAAPVCLGEHVRPERSPSGIEAIGLVPEAEEHLLDDFLGERAIADDAASEPERGGRVTSVHLRQRVVAETPDRHDELSVTRELQLPRLHVPDPVRRVPSCSLPGRCADEHPPGGGKRDRR